MNQSRATSKGYYWCKRGNRFKAQIQIDGRVIYLGSYVLENDARKAYVDACEELENEPKRDRRKKGWRK